MIPLRDSQPSYSTPYVTVLLIVVNVAVFLYEFSLGPYARNHFVASYGVVPDRLQPLTLLTSMFLHGGWWHLIGNMWFLWIYGDNVEDILGHGRYLLFYLLCGVAASLVHIVFNPFSRVPTIGASGAIAGVMGAYLVKFPRSTIVTLIPVIIFFFTVEIPAALLLLYWLFIQVVSGAGSLGSSADLGGVAWFAHIGGFAAGALLILKMARQERYFHRRDLYW